MSADQLLRLYSALSKFDVRCSSGSSIVPESRFAESRLRFKNVLCLVLLCTLFSCGNLGAQTVSDTENWQKLYSQGVAEFKRGELEKAESSFHASLETLPASATEMSSEARSLRALGALYTARALREEQEFNRHRLSANDVVSLIVILLVSGLLVLFLLKSGPQKPAPVVKVEHWIDSNKKRFREDGAAQFLSSLIAIGLAALVGLAILVAAIGGMHLIAYLQKHESSAPGVKENFDKARKAYTASFSLENREVELPDSKLVALYDDFIRGNGDNGAGRDLRQFLKSGSPPR